MKMQCLILTVLAMLALGSGRAWSDDAEKVEQLRQAPATSPESVRWFAQQPLAAKRIIAGQLGSIVLDSEDGRTFVVAFGAEHAPYPWALFVGHHRVELCEGNTFDFVPRDESRPANNSGIRWTFATAYDTKYTDARISFEKAPGKDSSGLSLWIDGTGWQYVGPRLHLSTQLLEHTAEGKATTVNR